MAGTILAPVEDGPWAKGIDSFQEATQVQKSYYRWGINNVNRGGIVRTRPGFSMIPVTTIVHPGRPIIGRPRGLTVFTDKTDTSYLVIAIERDIFYLKEPFDGDWIKLKDLQFYGLGPVCFVRCIQSVTEDDKGNLTEIDPIPMLIIQDGCSRAAYWDGEVSRHLDPSKKSPYGGPSETPIGLWGAWSGNRYWVSNGARLRASNLLNPIKFTEEDLLAEGGFLMFPGDITSVANTFDFQSLLVFTDSTTSQVASTLLDRTRWASTMGFQVVLLYGIGCVGGNAIGTQWGIKWWYAHDGLMSLDIGIRDYQSSKVTYRDREMAWSKGNISPGLKSRIAIGAYENLLFVSVPSGHQYNMHTWAMDEAPLDTLTYWGYFGLPAWSSVWEGIRPVAWYTATIKGVNRCFCLSQDNNGQNNVWEAVIGARVDSTLDADSKRIEIPIKCQLETKLMGYDGQYKFFRFAEIYLDNIEGEVDLTVSYAPRRGGYKQILQKHIVSSDWCLRNPSTQIVNDPSSDDYWVFDPMVPQTRVVRTISEAKTYGTPASPYTANTGDDIYQSVQTSGNVPFPHQKDYGFSLLLQWTGRLSISSVRVYFDAEEQEVEGVDEVDETTNRFVDMRGISVIDPPPKTQYILDYESLDKESNAITTTAPQWTDPLYSST